MDRLRRAFRGEAGSTHIRIWLLNFQTSGRVDFDDVVFTEIGPIVPCFRDVVSCDAPLRPLLTGAEEAPRISSNETMNGWRLRGIDPSDGLLKGGRGDVTLHWLPPAGKRPNATDTFRAGKGNEWIQTLRGVAVLSGETFETPDALNVFADLYNSRTSKREIGSDSDGNHFAVLTNNTTDRRSSLVSPPFPVSADHTYLQIARTRTRGGSVWIGRQWFPSGVSSYVITDNRDETWNTHLQLIEPPPGTSAASLWLINYDSTGEAHFDDVGFIDLGPALPF